VRDLNLPEFCGQFGISLMSACFLGPDLEDFNHVVAGVKSGDLKPEHMLLILNEGVVRQGQNPRGGFDAIVCHPEFRAMLAAGAAVVYMTKLPCMDLIRDQRLDFYQVAAGQTGPDEGRPRATTSHMAQRWLADLETKYAQAGVTERLP
jgi:hypothetical protein